MPVLAQTESSALGTFEVLIIVVLFGMLFAWVGKSMVSKADKSWLPRIVVWAFLAKMFGSLARFWMVTVLYGSGDSLRYHDAGIQFANIWRSGVVPVSTAGGEGTAFTEVVTGLLYAFYTPTFIGGFVMFAILAFVGQLFFYAAFRPWVPAERLKPYAMLVFFLPSLIFWPSSVGKDALMVLFLGVASYGASRMLHSYQFSALFFIAPGLLLTAEIRPHVAGIFGLSLVLALLFGKPPKKFAASPKRAMMILFSIAGAALAIATFAATFQVGVEGDDNPQDAGAFLEDVEEQTGQGGSAIEGGAVSSPAQLPLAFVTVLFRPLIHEGTSGQVILSALEGTAMLIYTIWKFPVMWRNKRLLREKPYLLMCFFYTGGFVIAFSAILNLGILARQRVQVLPMFLALLVGLGWEKAQSRGDEEGKQVDPRALRRPPQKEPATTTTPIEARSTGSPNGKAARHSRPAQRPAPTDSATARGTGRYQRQ